MFGYVTDLRSNTQALIDKDTHSYKFQEPTERLPGSERENGLLHQQLNDFGHQVQALLREIAHGVNPNPAEEDMMEAASSKLAKVRCWREYNE